MKTAQNFGYRSLLGLAVAGAALLSAPAAFAQTTPSPFFAFTVNNMTGFTNGPAYPVADPVDFTNLQINEMFADGFTQPLSLSLVGPVAGTAVGAGDVVVSPFQSLTALPGGGYSDATHGALTSALLTGTLKFDGIDPNGTGTISLTIQPTSDANATYQQITSTSFSANLFGANPTGNAVGTFSLLNLGSNQGTTVDIVPAAVPEASTTISFGLLLALGLGGVVLARHKRTAAEAV